MAKNKIAQPIEIVEVNVIPTSIYLQAQVKITLKNNTSENVVSVKIAVGELFCDEQNKFIIPPNLEIKEEIIANGTLKTLVSLEEIVFHFRPKYISLALAEYTQVNSGTQSIRPLVYDPYETSPLT